MLRSSAQPSTGDRQGAPQHPTTASCASAHFEESFVDGATACGLKTKV